MSKQRDENGFHLTGVPRRAVASSEPTSVPRQADTAGDHIRDGEGGGGATNLVESRETVHIGVVDVSAVVEHSEHLLGIAARAGGQKHGAIIELHLRLLLFQNRRLQVRLRAHPSL